MKQEQKDYYADLLKDSRWIKKRNHILSRDKNTCQFCGAQDKYLHVHHKAYFNGLLPWEYNDDILVTLCEDCHHLIHNNKENGGTTAKIGQIVSYWHFDFLNMGIVYFIDYVRQLVYTVECSNGASYDNIYYNCSTFKDFYYYEDCRNEELLDLFYPWFLFLSDHLNEAEPSLKFCYKDMLNANTNLQNILKSRDDYEYRQ